MESQVPRMASELSHCQVTVSATTLSGSSRDAVIGVPTLGRAGARVTVPSSCALVTVMAMCMESVSSASCTTSMVTMYTLSPSASVGAS